MYTPQYGKYQIITIRYQWHDKHAHYCSTRETVDDGWRLGALIKCAVVSVFVCVQCVHCLGCRQLPVIGGVSHHKSLVCIHVHLDVWARQCTVFVIRLPASDNRSSLG